MHLYALLQGLATVAFWHHLLTLSHCFARYRSNVAAKITSGSSFVHPLWHFTHVSHYGTLSDFRGISGLFLHIDKHFQFSSSTLGSTQRPHLAWPTTASYKDWWLWLLEPIYWHFHAISAFPSPKWHIQVAQLSLTNPRDALQHNGKIFKQSRDHVTPLLLVIRQHVARIDIAYSCTKLDDFRLSRSSNMIGTPKIL